MNKQKVWGVLFEKFYIGSSSKNAKVTTSGDKILLQNDRTKVAKSHGLAVRLTDIPLFSLSHDWSYFSHRFLLGSHSFVVFSWSFYKEYTLL